MVGMMGNGNGFISMDGLEGFAGYGEVDIRIGGWKQEDSFGGSCQ